jgi:hypothetical protein
MMGLFMISSSYVGAIELEDGKKNATEIAKSIGIEITDVNDPLGISDSSQRWASIKKWGSVAVGFI